MGQMQRRRVPYWPLKLDLKDPKTFERAVNENFRQIFQDTKFLPAGDNREAVVNDGTNWLAYPMDSFYFLGTGVMDVDGNYTVPQLDLEISWMGGTGVGMGPPPPTEPIPGSLFYFRADSTNTGTSNLKIEGTALHDVPFYEILRSDGTELSEGDIIEGSFVFLVWDTLTRGIFNGTPGTGNFAWRMILAGGSSQPGGTAATENVQTRWSSHFLLMGGGG